MTTRENLSVQNHAHFGKAMRERREALGLARAEIGRAMHVPSEFIRRLESGLARWTAQRRIKYLRACLETYQTSTL